MLSCLQAKPIAAVGHDSQVATSPHAGHTPPEIKKSIIEAEWPDLKAQSVHLSQD